jgi:hypothetical protein
MKLNAKRKSPRAHRVHSGNLTNDATSEAGICDTAAAIVRRLALHKAIDIQEFNNFGENEQNAYSLIKPN